MAAPPNNVVLKHHGLYVVQRRRCYLCGEIMANDPFIPRRRMATVEHVKPRSHGGTLYRNKLLAHGDCNARKGSRKPHPCELLLLAAVNEIMDWRRFERTYGTSYELHDVQAVG